MNKLYKIVREYALTSNPDLPGYGNGFDQYGRNYFYYLLKSHTHFRNWVEKNYPEYLPS